MMLLLNFGDPSGGTNANKKSVKDYFLAFYGYFK